MTVAEVTVSSAAPEHRNLTVSEWRIHDDADCPSQWIWQFRDRDVNWLIEPITEGNTTVYELIAIAGDGAEKVRVRYLTKDELTRLQTRNSANLGVARSIQVSDDCQLGNVKDMSEITTAAWDDELRQLAGQASTLQERLTGDFERGKKLAEKGVIERRLRRMERSGCARRPSHIQSPY